MHDGTDGPAAPSPKGTWRAIGRVGTPGKERPGGPPQHVPQSRPPRGHDPRRRARLARAGRGTSPARRGPALPPCGSRAIARSRCRPRPWTWPPSRSAPGSSTAPPPGARSARGRASSSRSRASCGSRSRWRGIAAVLTADPHLEVPARAPALLHRHGHELAYATLVEGHERIVLRGSSRPRTPEGTSRRRRASIRTSSESGRWCRTRRTEPLPRSRPRSGLHVGSRSSCPTR